MTKSQKADKARRKAWGVYLKARKTYQKAEEACDKARETYKQILSQQELGGGREK